MNALVLCVALSGLPTIATASPTSAGADIPYAVKRAASLNASSLNGVLVEERHIDLNVSAGPVHFSEQNDAVVLLEDGQYRRVRYVRIVQNGKVLSSDQVVQREAQNNDELDRGKSYLKQPYDQRYFHDYAYAEKPCACNAQEVEIAFHSEIRDAQHGDGTMIIDPSTGRVMSLTYAPNIPPPHASSESSVETFGEAAPGVWAIINIEHSYSGHVAFFRGTGTMTERMFHVQRFGNPASAMEYLQRAAM